MACAVRPSGTLRLRAVGKLKAKTFKVTAPSRKLSVGQSATVKLMLPRKARTAIKAVLRAGRPMSVRLTVVAVDASGNATTLKRTITLKLT